MTREACAFTPFVRVLRVGRFHLLVNLQRVRVQRLNGLRLPLRGASRAERRAALHAASRSGLSGRTPWDRAVGMSGSGPTRYPRRGGVVTGARAEPRPARD